MNIDDKLTLLQEKLLNKLKESNSKNYEYRYAHSIQVGLLANELISKYTSNKRTINKALIAGIIHDYCKYHKDFKTKIDLKYKDIFHSLCACPIIKKELKIKSRTILNAVKYHSSGKPRMNLVEKVIYVCDYIVSNNDMNLLYFALNDLNKAVYLKTCYVIDYLKSQNKPIYQDIYKTKSYYKKYKEGKNEKRN